MNPCPHADTTTLLWLYGEADDRHGEHVAGCPSCGAVAREHTEVLSAVGPVLPALRRPMAGHPARPALVLPTVLVGVAAAAALAVWTPIAGPADPPGTGAAADAPAHVVADPLDQRLDALEAEVADLTLHLDLL